MKDNPTIAAKLNNLLESIYNTGKIYQEATTQIYNPELKNVMEKLSHRRYALAVDIEETIEKMEAEPKPGSGVRADLQNTMMRLHSILPGDTEDLILEKCQAQDERTLSLYRKTLRANELPTSVENLLESQQKSLMNDYSRLQDALSG